MINKIFISTFIFTSFSSLACEVTLPRHLVVFSNNANLTGAITHTNCPENTLKEISETLKSVDGRMTAFQFNEILSSKNAQASITPDVFQVQQLTHLVREQVSLPIGYRLRSVESLNGEDFLSLESGDKLSINCGGCAFVGKDPIVLNVNSFSGESKKFTVMAQFKKMVKAYRVRNPQGAFTEVSLSALEEEYTESIPQTDLISDTSILRFYKCNKPIRAGELLKKSDLNPVSLVRAGVSTEVIIENELVKIKTNGISRSNGTIGDYVEVFQPQKNKKYYGKVIDLNKVHVEL